MEDIHTRLTSWQNRIAPTVNTIIIELRQQAHEQFNNDHYIFKELQIAAYIGKAWRSSLCMLSAESFGAKELKIAERAAALIELLPYALLIHDDIIDETPISRDTLSFPARLNAIFDGRGVMAYKKHGTGVAIAVGDYLLQFIINELTSLQLNVQTKLDLISLFTETLTSTTRAQVFDAVIHEPIHDVNNILNLYEAKTGTYSFVLPFMTGLKLNGNDDETIELFLKAIGESLGVVMQALDDLAGFKEDRNIKNLIEDINNKQPTLWCALLLPHLDQEEKEKFNYLFWLDSVPRSHAQYVRELCTKYEISEQINDIISDRTGLCHDLVHDLPISKQNRRLFHQFINLVQGYSGV